MLRFGSWVLKTFPAEAISEPIVFLYCKRLRTEKKDSSAPDQLLQALNFCSSILGLSVPARELRSARATGLAHQYLRNQDWH